ncbi:MAG: hypothetical protein ACYTFO_04175 [Planctomycetota bacterium]|jgi:hypothetical protein
MNRSFRILAGWALLACLIAGLTAGCEAPAETTIPDRTLLSLVADDPGATFGRYASMLLTITNTSDRAVMVTRVDPTTNPGGEAISLFGSAFGSTRYDPVTDTYVHDQVDQQATSESFCSGLLLPGESVTVRADVRPVGRIERFDVTCYAADQPYDQTAESLAPLNVYVLSDATSATGIERMFEPFSPQRWANIRATSDDVVAGISEQQPRSVLLGPGIHYAQQMRNSLTVSFDLADGAFTIEQANAAYARIFDDPADAAIVGYSHALGGYVIEEAEQTWLLTGPGQTDRGRILPRLPAAILNDVDRLGPSDTVRVQVSGDQSDHFGPDTPPTGRMLWETYPTERGDGMYTRGEFIRVSADQFGEFLERVHAHDKRLDVTYYFFSQRYFTLE